MADCNCILEDSIVTVKQYLVGVAGEYPISDETLAFLSVKCGVSLDSDISSYSELDRDKMEMTMLRHLLSSPGMTASHSDQNGAWSHKDGAVEMNSKDKLYLNNRLVALEKKYNINKSTAKIHNLGSVIYNGQV